jgi:cytochrome c oxidase subunit 2
MVMILLPFVLLLTLSTSDGHVYGARADSASGTLASEGAALFQDLGCSGCHMGPSELRAPRLEGLYGKMIALQDGSTVIADERYIRESILLPNSEIVAGYEPEMPSFAGEVTDDDLIRLIAYIKSLADELRPW